MPIISKAPKRSGKLNELESLPQRTRGRTPRQKDENYKANSEIRLIDIKAGFSVVGKQEEPGTFECMMVQLKTRDNEFRALLDTGINMLCQDTYRKISQREILDQEDCNFSIKGISDQPVQVRKKIYLEIHMYGSDLGINEFFVLDKETDKHDMILGFSL